MVEAPTAAALNRAKQVIQSAIEKKQLTPVLSIVEHGFPVNEPLVYIGANLLMLVADKCTETELNQILPLNPDINATDKIGRTALHYACRAGNLSTFKVLAELDDTDVDAVTNSGVTPLMLAVESADI